MRRQAVQQERMGVQLLSVHRCPHSDSSLLRCTVATAERSSAPFGPCASPPSHGGSASDNSAYYPARKSAPYCAPDACTADTPSAFPSAPAQVGRGASSRTARLQRAAHARAAEAATGRALAAQAWSGPPPCSCAGQRALQHPRGRRQRLRSLQSSFGPPRPNKLHLQGLQCASLHWRLLRAVSRVA